MVKSRSVLIAVAVGLFWGLVGMSIQAQDLDLGHTQRLVRPGYPSMTVYVWGSVGSPGAWEIERGMDLVDLLAAVGVPGLGVNEAGSRETLTLYIYRGETENRQEIYQQDVEALLTKGDAHPELHPEDVLMIESRTRRRIGARTIFETVRTVTSLLSLYLLLRGEF